MPRRSKRRSRNEEEVEYEEEGVKHDEDEEEQQQQEHDADNGNDENDMQIEEEEQQYEEDDEEEEETSPSKRRKKSKRPKQVMSASNQTDTQRRNLRRSQRQLYHKMTDTTQTINEKMGDVDSHVFETVREENNILWDKVRYTREAVLDGENVDLISGRAARQVDKLISVPRYDANRLAQKLRSKCSTHTNSSSNFDWKTFGLEVGSCFNSLPTYCSFLNGPIDESYKPKERKKPVRRVVEEDDAEEEEVGAVNQKSKSKDDNKLAAVEKQIKVLNKTLKRRDEMEKERYFEQIESITEGGEKKKFMKRVKKAAAMKPCAVQFVLNPDSFTQTVENIFGLSFLVKKGDAEVGVRTLEDCEAADLGTMPGPWVRKKASKANSVQAQPSARQAIVSFNMQDWRALREAYSVEKGDIPHRGKSRNGRASSAT